MAKVDAVMLGAIACRAVRHSQSRIACLRTTRNRAFFRGL